MSPATILTEQAKRRWLRLTPDRIVFLLLAAEGILFLSEHFHWFAFNEKKGWTVLIAVASVGLAMLLLLVGLAASIIFCWRFQFGIRSLLVMVLVAAIPCGWLGVEIKKAKRIEAAVQAIGKHGGTVLYDYEISWPSGVSTPGAEPDGSKFLRQLIGHDFFNRLVFVDFHPKSDGELLAVGELTDLRILALRYSRISDMGLECLKGLIHLQCLEIVQTEFTGTGLIHLKGLKELRNMVLSGSSFNDAGMASLAELTHIDNLHLDSTAISDTGLVHLKALPELKYLDLGHTEVTDAGLQCLKEMTQLNGIALYETSIGDAGLEQLRGLFRLEYLLVTQTKVTEDGVKALQQALPTCNIRQYEYK